MNVKREIIILAIQILSSKTQLVRKPEPFEDYLNAIFGLETYEERMARNIEVELDRATEVVKRVNLNRKFKKIVRSV